VLFAGGKSPNRVIRDRVEPTVGLATSALHLKATDTILWISCRNGPIGDVWAWATSVKPRSRATA
jgi:hypothetical protein